MGGVDITSGGAIAVDTEALRAVGERLGGVARMLTDAGDAVRRASGAVRAAPGLGIRVDAGTFAACQEGLDSLAERTTRESAGTRLMA
ncbi:MAG: hypothetical protein WA971_13675, partial [Microbacterium sp.]